MSELLLRHKSKTFTNHNPEVSTKKIDQLLPPIRIFTKAHSVS